MKRTNLSKRHIYPKEQIYPKGRKEKIEITVLYCSMPLNDLHLINYLDKPKFISSTLIIIFKQRKGEGGPT